MKAYVQHPRFLLDLTEISGSWEVSKSFGYKSVYKFGYDEDVTTLAVNCYLEYIEIEPIEKLVIGVGECNFNFGVFIEATGLSSNVCEVIQNKELSGIRAMYEAISKNCHTMVIDAPTAEAIQDDLYLSPVAMICSTDGLKCSNYTKKAISISQKPRYLHGNFVPDDSKLVEIYKSLESTPDVLLISNLRLARSFKSSEFSIQKSSGYSGAATPIIEMLHLLQSKKTVDVVCSDGVDLFQGEFSTDEMSINQSTSYSLPVTKYVQKFLIADSPDPGRVAQGAYISTSSYLAAKESRYRLRANKCTDCAKTIFPPRLRCKYCGGKTEVGKYLNRNGKVYSITNILKGAAPTEFDRQQSLEGEYLVAIIELEDDVRIISQITDTNLDDLIIGDNVIMVFRKIYNQDSLDRYGYKFSKL